MAQGISFGTRTSCAHDPYILSVGRTVNYIMFQAGFRRYRNLADCKQYMLPKVEKIERSEPR